MIKIYTKGGDKGLTSLLGGERVQKCDPKVVSYGNIDELNSWIGYIISSMKDAKSKHTLVEIQKILFTIGSNLALSNKEDAEKYKISQITEYDVGLLETQIDEMTEQLPLLKNFILPGGNDAMCKIHIARTVCRRAERSLVENTDLFIIKYINRLSDYLFTLARFVGHIDNIEEIKN
jgi:cob(I)alamin adenosyltransferase